ncbi:MAG: hypothetical protein V2A58_13640 [Planctomycetota bacterium]
MARRRHWLCVLFALLLAGCATTTIDEGPAPAVNVPAVPPRLNTAVIVDKSLQNWAGGEKDKYAKVAVEATNSRRTPTGTLEVWAELRNRTDYPLQVEARVQFFDADRSPVEGPSAWQRVFLPPRAVETYREFSTNVYDVNYYYIEIREGR